MNSQVSDLDNSSLNFLRTSNLIGFVRMNSNGTFVEVNDAFLDLVGYSREEFIGKMTWRDITPPEFFDVSVQTHQRVIHTGTSEPIEKDYIRKDGARRTVLIGSVRAGTGDDVVGFILDITQRKANERALDEAYALLRQSEARFRRLMDANVIGVGFYHLDGRFLDANDALLNLVGYSRAELEAGQFRWDALTPAEFRHLDERAMEELRTTGKCAPYEKEYLLRDGRRVSILIGASFMEGNSQEGFCFVLDNTARRAAERALQEAHRSLMQSEEKFRLAVLQCPDIMYFMDADLRFTWISKVSPPMREEDVVGKTDLDFPPREQAEMLAAAKRRVMQTRKGERVLGRTFIRGELHYFESAIEPRIQDGKVIGVAGYFRDMTAWREKELELSQANASLEQMRQTLEQRVEERTADLARSESLLRESEEHYRQVAEHNQRLVRDVEHRVRNHLSGLVGLVQVMRGNATSVENFADAIESRLRAMVHVHQVLAAAGWDAVELRSLIESTLASLSYVTPHACDIAVAGPPLAVNPQQALPLALIMAEWFTNSSKYGSCGVPGGILRVAWTITNNTANNAHPPSESPAAPPRGNSQITLTWTESAGPPIPPNITPSVGTALVQGFATRELQGECELRYPPQGAAHTLRFPLGG
jgi:PAS domain S-box-containing protein